MPATNFSTCSRTLVPLALLAAVAMTCLQGAAFAGTVPMDANDRSVSIRTAGLDLADPATLRALDARIDRAARQVCKPVDGRDLQAMGNRAACERAARTGASARRDQLVARAQAGQLAARGETAPGTTN
jgi:UrcA family protein